MHDLLTTAWITVLVVGALWTATFLFDFLRAPALLHKQQQQIIEDQARSIQDPEKKTSEPVLSPQQRANRKKAADAIAGASEGELKVLKYILESEGVGLGSLYRVFSGQGHFVDSSLNKWTHLLIQGREDPQRTQTTYSIIPGFRDALSHVLYNSESE